MQLSVSEALKKGVEAHKAGQLQEAEKAYTNILKAQPNHPDANHNMGILAVGVGKPEASIPFFNTATVAKPQVVQFWLSYVNALIALGRIADGQAVLSEALVQCAKAGESAAQAFELLQQKLIALGVAGPGLAKGNILDTVKLDKALRLAEKAAKGGRVDEAIGIYQDILSKFPKHKSALKAFGLLASSAVKKQPEPPADQLQALVSLYTQGQLKKALLQCRAMLEAFPKSVVLYNIAGAANVGLQRFDAAIDSYQQALKVNPNYADAYYNMGIALDSKGDPDAAIKSYKKAISLKPDYADAYANIGFALNNKGDLDGAITSYQKVLTIDPNNAQAYNNMGNSFKDKGDLVAAIKSYSHAVRLKPDYAEAYNNRGSALIDRSDPLAAVESYKKALEINPEFVEVYNNLGVALGNIGRCGEAVDCYSQALKIKPDYADAKLNLATLLAIYEPQTQNSNVIVAVNASIKQINIKSNDQSGISDNQVIDALAASTGFIALNNLDIKTAVPQAFRRNSVELNCKRHMSVFKKHDVIPEFCFGCYKVQVEPRSVIDLIKLFFVFDQLKLDNNNTRKCMIELRPLIPGFYKGLIYCSSLEQANEIAVQLDAALLQQIGAGLSAQVKRGCSEYPVSYPDYKEINNAGPQLMNYDPHWKSIEAEHDSKNLIQVTQNRPPTLAGLNLSDALAMEKWIDYAKGIGDPSVSLINQDAVCFQATYDAGKARLERFEFNPK